MKTGAGAALLLLALMLQHPGLIAQNLNNPNKRGPLGTQVNTLTGNLFVPRSDLYIPSNKLSIDIRFFYNSFYFNRDFGYGRGWSFAYNIQYREDATTGNKIVLWGDGREDNYDTLATGGYKTPRGFYAALTQYAPGKFLVKELNGTRYFFDNPIHRKLTKIDEPNGNYINFSYTDSLLTGISNGAGQSITLTYNAQGRLATVVDAMANPTRTFTYNYDNAGNLVEVKDPLNAGSSFTYMVNGPMKTLSDKNQNTINIIYFPDMSARELIGCNKRLSFSYDTSSNTTVVTDHLEAGNIVTKFIYDHIDDLYWVKSVEGNCCGNTTQYEYDEQGNKLKTTDANGNAFSYTYDAKGNMLSATDPMGGVSIYTYSSDFNRVSSYTDPKGNKTTMTYDAKGNITAIILPGGSSYTAAYNALGNIVTGTDPMGNIYTYNHDAWGNPTTVVGPNGYSATLAYDIRGNLLSYTDPRGNTRTAGYDILNRLKQIKDPLNQQVRMSYDAAGNLVSLTNQGNETTYLNYDASNRVVKITNPATHQFMLAYDGMDNLVSLSDPLGATMKFAFDKLNKLKTYTDKAGNSQYFDRNANGNITMTALANDQKLFYAYDKLDRLTEVGDNSGIMYKYAYDEKGNVKSITDGNGGVTVLAYNSRDRVVKITDALGNSTQLTYDANDNIVSITDREGHTAAYTYDGHNRVKTYTKNAGGVITQTYDASGNIASLTDENGNATTFEYDVLNRRTRMTFSDGTYRQYSYDAKGNLTAARLTDGTTIQFGYDVLNRMTTKTLPGGEQFTYTYDVLGRVVSAANSNGTVSFTYDLLDRLASETFAGRTTKYSYDIAGRTQTTIYPDSTVVIKEFDERNRLVSIFKDSVLIASYAYNNGNQQISRTYSNGAITQMQYDFGGRLLNLNSTSSAGDIQKSSFTYDKELNKTAITRNHATALNETFTYDANYRLSNYKRGTGGSATQNIYTYDAVGNRTAASISGTAFTYTKNSLNQVTAVNGVPFTYDPRGNITYDGKFYKTYDAENKLLKDSLSPAFVIGYAYDALGRKISKSVNGQAYKYGYSGPIAIEERNSSDVVLNSTIYSGFLAPLLNMKGGALYFYHANEMGSVEAMSNEAGRIVEKYSYDAFGKLSRYDSLNNPLSSSIAGNRAGFTGQEYDSATAAYQFYYRNYSPENGTFNQRDPLEYSDATSMYQYVGNNPANGLDIWGLQEGTPPGSCPADAYAEQQDKDKSKLILDVTNNTITATGFLSKISEGTKGVLGAFGVLPAAADFGMKVSNAKSVTSNPNSTYQEMSDANWGAVGSGGGLVGGVAGTAAFITSAAVAPAILTGAAVAGGYGLTDAVVEGVSGKSIGVHAADHTVHLQDRHDFENWANNNGLAADIYDFTSMNRPGVVVHSEQYPFLKNLWDHDKMMTYLMWKESQNLYYYIPNICGGGTKIKVKWVWDPSKRMWILIPIDPNLIVGPEGIEEKKWINAKDRMPYTIMFENDSLATARARYVKITTPVEPEQDVTTLELGSVSFNNQTFDLPASLASYYQRLDARDSTGVFVDLTAGYDVLKHEIFWELRAIDPITLMPPDDPLAGFLLLHDTTQPAYGNGFVSFSLRPRPDAATQDTIAAKAEIIFDENEMIPTNVHTNTIDALPPETEITSVIVSTTSLINMSWAGADDAGGVGIDYYSIYVATDKVNYSLMFTNVKATDTSFSVPAGKEYCFFVLATDRVGNTETLDPAKIKCVTSGEILPVTWLYFNGQNKGQENILQWATGSEQDSKHFDVERSLTGNDFSKIGSVAAAGNSVTIRRYSFIDRGIDKLNNNVMYYRLRQVDTRGGFKHSSIVKLNYDQQREQRSIVYPNPTRGLIMLRAGSKVQTGSEAVVMDINGRVVKKIIIQGTTQVIDLDGYANGVYIIKLANNEVLRVVKQ